MASSTKTTGRPPKTALHPCCSLPYISCPSRHGGFSLLVLPLDNHYYYCVWCVLVLFTKSPCCNTVTNHQNPTRTIQNQSTGVCLLAVLLGCLRKRSQHRRREEKLATLDMLNKRRPAPSVSLAVEGMAQPDSPDQVCIYEFSCVFLLALFFYLRLLFVPTTPNLRLSLSTHSCVRARAIWLTESPVYQTHGHTLYLDVVNKKQSCMPRTEDRYHPT